MIPRLTHQQRLIYDLLAERANEWVGLPEILRSGVAQYNARILELRRLGYNIENRTWWVGSQRRSAFRLTVEPRQLELLEMPV